MTYAHVKFELAMFNGLGGGAFTRKTLNDLDLGVTQNVAQYPLFYVTYAPTMKLLRPTVWEEMHLQENSAGVKVT